MYLYISILTDLKHEKKKMMLFNMLRIKLGRS